MARVLGCPRHASPGALYKSPPFPVPAVGRERSGPQLCYERWPDPCCRPTQEVDKQVPDEKRKGKMRTVQEMEYLYEPEMEGAPVLPGGGLPCARLRSSLIHSGTSGQRKRLGTFFEAPAGRSSRNEPIST